MWNHGKKAPLTDEIDMWIVCPYQVGEQLSSTLVPYNIPMVEQWKVVLAHIQESNLLPENYTKYDI